MQRSELFSEKPDSSITVAQIASPITSAAVVLVVGAKFSGQISLSTTPKVHLE